jgi:hypothetical protein
LVDLTNCVIEQIDLTKLVREQNSAHLAKNNMNMILKLIKRTNYTKSICLVSEQMRPDLIKIISNCDDNLKIIKFNINENNSNTFKDLIGWDQSYNK